MMKPSEMISLAPLFLLVCSATIPKGSALEPYLKLYPSQGTIYTDILLEYRAEIFPFLDQYATQGGIWIYWDNKSLATGVKGDFAVPPVYGLDYHFSPPNEYPYSELGSHNVTLKVWSYSSPGTAYVFNATFEIVEYYPPADLFYYHVGIIRGPAVGAQKRT